MFKKAKQKIVISIFLILCAVLVITLVMIYLSSYYSVTSQNYEVLEGKTEMLLNGRETNDFGKEPDDGRNPNAMHGDAFAEKSRNQGKIDRGIQVGTFYSVKFDQDGNGIVIDNKTDGLYSDEELLTLAEEVRTESRGSTGDLLYIVSINNGETYVSFMDNTVFTENFTKLFMFTLIFGLVAIGAVTLISIGIANRIVSPMEENYNKQKQFTADAGHELKTPIAAVAANIELLKREVGENKWLDNITYENERMRELVTELLELARNENRTAERKETDLSRLVNGAILPMEAAAFEKSILIESDIAEGVNANIDAKGISQLVTILVDNAVSHAKIPEGGIGKVGVTLEKKKNSAVLSVSNVGDEISEKDKDKLFERFYRADSSHEFTGHYGLGLAIAKAIADANGAKISVCCENGLVTFRVDFA